MQTEPGSIYQWLRAGDEMFPAMLAAIDAAARSVCLEIYTFEECPLGRDFREALMRACKRGVRVRVLVDSVGSYLFVRTISGNRCEERAARFAGSIRSP